MQHSFSPSWLAHMEELVKWTEDAILLAKISERDYAHFQAKLALEITDQKTQRAVVRRGATSGYLLRWIADGVAHLNALEQAPSYCVIADAPNLDAYASAWGAHVGGERRGGLEELHRELLSLRARLEQNRATFDGEETDGHSSYSDYSEETESDTDEDEDDAADTPVESRPRGSERALRYRVKTPSKPKDFRQSTADS